ncbi:Astacin-like metalloprotease toxin [Dinothrombium tinctorium]|uniref:Metalloendopeptidase n=1 Tax=Dinothrombium tinctorium TaxID=1965070 RepID=A0A443R4X7_9ACAR|nr:Astacin-like metalloprotease toxin [Dinothrombium tinctorium]
MLKILLFIFFVTFLISDVNARFRRRYPKNYEAGDRFGNKENSRSNDKYGSGERYGDADKYESNKKYGSGHRYQSDDKEKSKHKDEKSDKIGNKEIAIENSKVKVEGETLMEGDILMPEGTSRNAIANNRNLWPNGVVPYEIDPQYPHGRRLIDEAIAHIERQTCVKFVPRKDEKNYVFIFSGSGCYSHVGRIGGEQRLSLHPGCQNIGTVLHELLHAIGFYHAHNRSDRDKYLKIHWDNIQQSQRHNFRQLSSSENKLFFPNNFDYNSIMLYGPTAFSKDGYSITMSAKEQGARFVAVRQKHQLSREDVLAINYLYKCERKSHSNNILPSNRYPNRVYLRKNRPTRPYFPFRDFYFPFHYFG